MLIRSHVFSQKTIAAPCNNFGNLGMAAQLDELLKSLAPLVPASPPEEDPIVTNLARSGVEGGVDDEMMLLSLVGFGQAFLGRIFQKRWQHVVLDS